ncbi:MAG: polysaccharide deacetylase family protein, partial [Verrucomicrobia bacterium]|nr:polysaccharide deacetylase family protein [Verrucomicrobiota bacterium]
MLAFATSLLLAGARRFRRHGVVINGHHLAGRQARGWLEVLGRWFEFIGPDQLGPRLAAPGRRPFCLLTFDDGKRTHFTEIAPELERRRVPAVFYVTTEPLSTGACLWFDRRTALIRTLGHCPAGLELEALKRLRLERLVERLDRACAEHGLSPGTEPEDLRPMSWEQARDLARRGFTIGAHGLTHAILTRVPPDRARVEIEGSLAKVSAELGAPCGTFAFPNGNHTAELARHACRCGAATVMTTEPMWVGRHSPLWRLPRIQLFGEFNRARIELKLALAAVEGLLTNPDGSGRAYRSAGRRHRSQTPQDQSLCAES